MSSDGSRHPTSVEARVFACVRQSGVTACRLGVQALDDRAMRFLFRGPCRRRGARRPALAGAISTRTSTRFARYALPGQDAAAMGTRVGSSIGPRPHPCRSISSHRARGPPSHAYGPGPGTGRLPEETSPGRPLRGDCRTAQRCLADLLGRYRPRAAQAVEVPPQPHHCAKGDYVASFLGARA